MSSVKAYKSKQQRTPPPVSCAKIIHFGIILSKMVIIIRFINVCKIKMNHLNYQITLS